jgi:hypothetical protein
MKAPQSLQDIQRVAQIMSSSTEDAGEAHAGAALMGSSGTLATLYQDPEMSKASIAGAGIMGLSAHGFANSRDITNAANMMAGGKYDYSAADVEDPDKPGSGKMVGGGNFGGGHAEHAPLALSVATKAQLLGARSRPDIKAGYGMMYDGNGKFLDGMVSKDKGGGGRAEAVVKSLNSHDLASAKPGSVRRLNGTINEILDKGGPDATAVRDQIFSWAGPYSQASVDVKSEALEIINSRSAADPGGFGKEWIRYARMEDPDARAGGAPPDPGGAGGDGH